MVLYMTEYNYDSLENKALLSSKTLDKNTDSAVSSKSKMRDFRDFYYIAEDGCYVDGETFSKRQKWETADDEFEEREGLFSRFYNFFVDLFN